MSRERWEIKLINVGKRNAFRIYESRCDTLIEVEACALTHCKNQLTSKGVYLKHLRDLIYGVYDGGGLVGTVSITSIPEKPKCQTHQKP